MSTSLDIKADNLEKASNEPDSLEVAIAQVDSALKVTQVKLRSIVESEEKPKPQPEPKPGPEPTPRTRKPTSDLVARGQDIIERKKLQEGALPTFSVDYRRHLGFKTYVRQMRRIGGRFFVLDRTRRDLIAELGTGGVALSTVGNVPTYLKPSA